MEKPLLKITFNELQTLQERVDNGYGEPFKCLHIITNTVKELRGFSFKIYVLGGYFGFIDPCKIKSIEFIQPNEL